MRQIISAGNRNQKLALAALLLVALLIPTLVFADPNEDESLAHPFELALPDDGVASLPVFLGPFPDTANMELLSQLSPNDLGARRIPGVWAKGMMNDVWGWTSPGGEEYALATNSGGIAVVRVTDPENPVYLGKIQSQSPANFGNIWGDPATFGHYAYFVTEIVDSKVVVLDMSALDALGAASSPDSLLPAPVSFFAGGGYRGAHNVRINEDSGFAYLAGVRLASGAANNACGLGLPPRFNTLILDLNANPVNPPVVACVANAGEHDFYVVNYSGPDADYSGHEIAFVFDGRDRTGAAIGGFTEIWDVTNKAAIQVIASFRLPGLVFSHNGWTTDEQDVLFIGDEVDELVLAGWAFTPFFAQPPAETTNMPQTGTYIVDVSDLDSPVFVERFEDGTVGLDHNFVVEGDKLYIASYTSGTRVLQIDRNDGVVSLSPIAHMDTEPRLQENILNVNQEENFGSAFLGQWGIYTFPDSDTIIATDINNGLIVMRLSDEPCHGPSCNRPGD